MGRMLLERCQHTEIFIAWARNWYHDIHLDLAQNNIQYIREKDIPKTVESINLAINPFMCQCRNIYELKMLMDRLKTGFLHRHLISLDWVLYYHICFVFWLMYHAVNVEDIVLSFTIFANGFLHCVWRNNI